ncbi:peroxiredoxin [Sporohalobacter salinus]|uniref:peroxiredoxin n=1 Tax=Sporohalobacter salinus TaxID=1494606 RepID=UPI0019619C4D|nr:peroxiredoxin [Sporohalobacter salinus]MBM7623678.1 peroxiredoxin [Sporohalobacter salinus]
MSEVIKTGEQIKDFKLKDQNENQVNLSDFTGQKVLLSFHPLAWTSVCGNQMSTLEDNKEKFDKLNTVALGISVDPAPSKNAWADKLNVKETRLLSDFWPHGGLAKSLGIFREEDGFSERANILIDEDGKVIWSKVYDILKQPDIEEVINVIKDNS